MPAQFAADDVTAYEVKFMESKVEKPNDNVTVEQPAAKEEVSVVAAESTPVAAVPASDGGEIKSVEYDLNDVVEYQELLTKYSTLEN